MMPKYLVKLGHSLVFPPLDHADESGLLAVGGDLSVPRLLKAYRSAVFPWPIGEDYPLTWFSPNPRAVMELDRYHASKSLLKKVRQARYECTINRCFHSVITACAAPSPGREGTWITEELKAAYLKLHEEGHAHSVEIWEDSELVGGLYGVSVGGLFSGESMFSRRSDASKLALYHLVERLKAQGFGLLDIQQRTDFMVSQGATEMRRSAYLARIEKLVDLDRSFVP